MRIYLIPLFILIGCQATGQNTFLEAKSHGEIENSEINEASGLATSINNPNMLWTHNDSGDKARIFLLDEQGRFKAEYYLTGLKNRDWEDIAIGPGPEKDKNYLYVADIGDNRAVHELKYIYRFVEPALSNEKRTIDSYEIITFQFPDGKRDSESMFVDPQTKDIYVLSKREKDIGIYRATYPQSTSETIILDKLGTLPYFNTVAADITPDGQEIITKTYDAIYYWKRNGESIADLLMSEPEVVPYLVEPQGESIAWKKDGTGFFTLSEEPKGVEAVLYFYQKK